jgi:hypothetical protein
MTEERKVRQRSNQTNEREIINGKKRKKEKRMNKTNDLQRNVGKSKRKGKGKREGKKEEVKTGDNFILIKTFRYFAISHVDPPCQFCVMFLVFHCFV